MEEEWGRRRIQAANPYRKLLHWSPRDNLSRLFTIDDVGVTIGGSGDGGLHGFAKAMSRLSVLINQWGPSYFEQDEDIRGGGLLYPGASDAVASAARGGGSVTKSSKAVPYLDPEGGHTPSHCWHLCNMLRQWHTLQRRAAG